MAFKYGGSKEHYDYNKQAWVDSEGRYMTCGHTFTCGCYGKLHAGEVAPWSQEYIAQRAEQITRQAIRCKDCECQGFTYVPTKKGCGCPVHSDCIHDSNLVQ